MSLVKTKTRRVKFWWRLTLAYSQKYKWYLVLILIGLVLIGAFISWILPDISEKNTINIGYVGNYTLETLPPEALTLATKTLVAVDNNGRPVPSLASHWTISPDGKTYVIFLKDNLKWHDDTPVNARDITIAINNVEINALNNQAIEFKLPNPISSFLLALDKPVFKSKTFYGTSNYRITHIDQVDDRVTKISLVPSSANLPKVNVKFYPGETQALTALKVGDIKTGTFTSAQEVENWPNLNVNKQADNEKIITIFFNNNDELLSSKDLRQALIYSINRTEFDGETANSPIAPNNWAYNSAVKKYEYNTGKARELIANAQVKGKTITLSYIPSYRAIAEKVKKDWTAVGINVVLKEESQVPKNYQAFLTINQLSPDPDQYALWHSSQAKTNITGYKNVKIDKLLEDARSTQDEKEREALYADFQRFLVEDAPAAFLYHPFKYQISYKNVQRLLAKLPKD
ncbi:ABC transporter substrate-binding protein [Candidatus Curtissbacteria bacterium]|nr:ABC transporter substrate-binding protein [Candidatus Curtissbacteria bacterium]